MALLIALIAVVLSATISYSYLVSQDSAIKIASNIQTQAQARAIAEAGMELAIGYVQNDANWRTARPNGTWAADDPFAGGSFTIVGQDGQDTNGDGIVDGDGSLSDDPADRLTLTLTGKFGGSTSILRTVVTPVIDEKTILCVVGNPSNPTAIDLSRQSLIESWGWGVSWADDGTAQAALLTMADSVNAVLVCDSAAGLSDKLKISTSGTVVEDGGLCASFDIASTYSTFTAADSNRLDILSNSHYITSPFSLGSLTTGPMSALVEFPSGTYAPDMVNLAERMDSSTRLLAAIESGGILSDSTVAAGRRVFMPFGKMPASELTGDGQTLLKRSLEWADASTGASSFGYGTKFNTARRTLSGKQVAVKVTLPEAGTLTAIVAFIRGTIGKNVRYAIYADASGEPGARIAQSSVQPLTSSSIHWKRINLTGVALTAGTYWLALGFDDNNSRYRYASTGGQLRYNNNNAISNGFTGTWGSSTATYARKMNIYGIYTPASGSGSGGGSGTYSIDGGSFDWQ